MAKKQQNYNENQITILEGLEAVRKRPGMYIGNTSSKGLHHLVWEIVDNSIDEYLAGYCSEITLSIHKDDSITVEDNGRGIPVGKHPQMGIPTLEVVLTVLHAGGKFGGEGSGYKVSGGLHGVGSSCVNALSDHMIATVKRDGKVYQMEFSKGKKIKDLEVVGTCSVEETGTKIWFKPDAEIFKETTEYEYITIFNRMRESAFLNKGLKINVIDEKQTEVIEETKEEVTVKRTLVFERGIEEYVEHVNKNKKPLHPEVIYIKDIEESIEVEIALQYHDGDGRDGIFSFTNNIKTIEGGSHETGFKSALTSTVKNYITQHELMKGKELPNGDDTRSGITAIVTVKVEDPQFEGQTKGKLTNSEVRPVVDRIVQYHLTRFFEENPQTAEVIVKKIIDACELRIFIKKQSELEKKRKKGQSKSFTLPEKLAECNVRNIKDPRRELYIVEGDSAGGSAKQGREKEYQAILPLRGKVINTEKASLEKILENAEIDAMIKATGTEIKDDFNYENRRYEKIVIMTDADVDGEHIRILLLTFFFRYMRPLIEKGNVYMAQPPLYKVKQGNKKEEYAYSDRELDDILKNLPATPKPTIQRYKGLGEMNPEQLWETTMDPERRTLLQVTIDDAAEAEVKFTQLMGDDPNERKKFIYENGHLATSIDS